jgi:choline dehydrogenase-like flavoprotein
MRLEARKPYVRFGLRLGCRPAERPKLRDAGGKIRLGDEILAGWRTENARGVVWLNALLEVVADVQSQVKLDRQRPNRLGDPTATIQYVSHPDAARLWPAVKSQLDDLVARLVREAGGRDLGCKLELAESAQREIRSLKHVSGGCRIAARPNEGVCDPFGRTFDHPNLFVVGAPNCVSPGCTNPTLTFVALAVRSAHHVLDEDLAG